MHSGLPLGGPPVERLQVLAGGSGAQKESVITPGVSLRAPPALPASAENTA